MISAGRCINGRSVMSKECRVNCGSGGYVNHCEQDLDDKSEMVMGIASKISTTDQLRTSNNHKYSSCENSEIRSLKDFSLGNLDLIDELKVIVNQKDKTIEQLSDEVNFLKKKLEETKQQLVNLARKESIDTLPFTPVTTNYSSGIGDINSIELQTHGSKVRKRKQRQMPMKRPCVETVDNNQLKKLKNRIRTKSGDSGKMQELSLITSENAYYTCLGNYDPIKDDPLPESNTNNLEIPSWRVKNYTSWYSMEGTENMSDDIFESRHSRLELWERKRKRWDMQRLRELRRIEYLKEGRNKSHYQNSNDSEKEELVTLLPDPSNIKAIEITDNLPVSAFGCNLHTKKKPEEFKFCHSRWCNDGSQEAKESKIRGLRSSGRGNLFDNL
ncbi:male-specific lethal 1-like 1 [Daktulosphaira vitifoliae]|uniref:male-specific lethal 1-like 1 n=1 Tax=Daktulosphaira vitifoliae TaxID=58002 RepID=UPI0021A98836|nr:male-specific lethal 1-like 1 [Daktulosphaira vitifoliae]